MRPIEVSALTKRYGRTTALDGVDLHVEKGQVYGLLGRNGAGKTTLMRTLLGLVRPGSGTVRVLGHPPGDPAVFRRVGALIEGAAFYPHLTGRDNLRLLTRYSALPESEVDKALARVGLADRAGDRYRGYSQGMKQRLGVASALLGTPELVVLDEPANGLDPASMAALRQLIRDVEGTVLLSSHLLGEVAQVCDRVGVLRDGRLVFEGTLAELTAGGRSLEDRFFELTGADDWAAERRTA
ncbi:ABC transporter ATP-binding protein [Amycolatopsis magusensis]|uniref:ABC transporter ATP-binding protein n=1 Tax=Amycolatopsis magusensis TaxID=882444 RepID=UPI00379DDA6D